MPIVFSSSPPRVTLTLTMSAIQPPQPPEGMPKDRSARRILSTVVSGLALPAALYLLLYYLLTYPLLHQFNTRFFCGTEDGYQNIWNLWWTNHALTHLRQWPWYTTWIHYPQGTSLIAHTLAPFNGFVGTVLQSGLGLSLHQTYNTIVVFSFVMTGVTTFWLARRVSGSYPGALFAGAAFTFTHFHFAHAHNHLQMVSLEWLPLAVLAIYEMLARPRVWKGIAAALALFLVALCDFHLTFYAVMAGVIMGLGTLARLTRAGLVGGLLAAAAGGMLMIHTPDYGIALIAEALKYNPKAPPHWGASLLLWAPSLAAFIVLAVVALFARRLWGGLFWGLALVSLVFNAVVVDSGLHLWLALPAALAVFVGVAVLLAPYWPRFRDYALPLAVFTLVAAGTTGALAYKLLHLNKTDPLQHSHNPKDWSTDLVDPLVPGWEWRFHGATRPIWGPLADDPAKEFIYIEHSLYVGWAVVLLGLYAWWRRATVRAAGTRDLGYWATLVALFFLLSLGPLLHVRGKVLPVPGFYWVLEAIFPPLKMGGVPMRLMAMVFLAGAVMAACGAAELFRRLGMAAVPVFLALVALWAVESLPRAQTTTPTGYPFWVTELRKLPPGPVVDTTYHDNMFAHLYYATGHGHPVGEGYISRYPRSVEQRRGEFRRLVENGEWRTLRQKWGFKYLVVRHHVNGLNRLIGDGEVRVYALP